jgi:hypothetical protein
MRDGGHDLDLMALRGEIFGEVARVATDSD